MILYVVVLISSTLGKESPRGCISCSVCRSHSKRISDPHFLIALGTHPHQSTLSLSLFFHPASSLSGSKSIFWDGHPPSLSWYLPSSFLTTARGPRSRPQAGAGYQGYRGGTLIDGESLVVLRVSLSE